MDALLSKAVRRILVYFMVNPSRELYLRELAAQLDVDPGNLSKDLQRLAAMGILSTRERGRLKLFTLNKNHPLYRDLRGIILKTEAVEMQLQKALEPLEGIKEAFLYGSYASGSMDAESDIDLMIVGKVDTVQLAALLRPLEKQLGRQVQYRIIAEAEFNNRMKKKDPFLTNVFKTKTIPVVSRRKK